MKTALYRKATRHAWHIIWTHKRLWLFAFFATFISQMGLIDMLIHFSAAAKVGDRLAFVASIPQIIQDTLFALHASGIGLDTWVWLVWVSSFIFCFGIMLVFVAIAAQGALVQGVAQSIRHEHRHINVNDAWNAGVTHIWRLSGLHLLKYISLIMLSMLLGLLLSGLAAIPSNIAMIIFAIVLLLAITVGSIISFLLSYSAAYVVIENRSFKEALLDAWDLFRSHVLVSLEVALVVLGCNLLILGSMAGLAVFFIFEIQLLFSISWLIASPVLLQLLIVLVSMIFLLILIFLGTMLTSFTTAIWTYLFMKMHHHGLRSHVMTLLRR